MTTTIEQYLSEGCMRCKYGGTPQCKVHTWRSELELLRQIVLQHGLKEEIKWGMPVYTLRGKNIITINALRASANIGFFKGALLKDTHQLLQQQGNIQSARIIRFTNTKDIINLTAVLGAYILEAIAVEETGLKVALQKQPEPIPETLLQAFEADPALQSAFYKLTPGRQRGYLIYFSAPRQAQTSSNRIQKCKEQILNGIGLHDKV